MPVNYQLVPEHGYPSQLVRINDNTEVTPVYPVTAGGTTALFVFCSPKGHDNKLQTISGLGNFMAEYGLGPFAEYGQPLLNAYNCAVSGAATLHCMRVMPADAAYSYSTLVAKVKVDKSTAEPPVNTMTIKFENKTTAILTDMTKLADIYTASEDPDSDGFTEYVLFNTAYQGRGKCGNSLRWRLTSDMTRDKDNGYKNYGLSIYENDGTGLVQKEIYSGNFIEDATYNQKPIFMDALVVDPNNGSNRINFVTHTDSFNAIFEAYKAAYPDTELTVDTFDPLLGVNKFTKKAITGLVILPEDTAKNIINPASLLGVGYEGGADGSFDVSKPAETRTAAINAAYLKAFNGELDPMIKSKRRFPTNIIFDAGFPDDVKMAIAQLASTRTDCEAILDLGTSIVTKQSPLDKISALDPALNSRQHDCEGYAGKIIDPYSKKAVTVTSTYGLAAALPSWFAVYNGKHKPMAGVNYGVVSGYLAGSLYPVYDEDLDSVLMDDLVDAHINFLKVNSSGEIVRATQNTCQDRNTVMSELSNAFLLLDIKRDAERVCDQLEYQFADGNLSVFNATMANVAEKYAAAMVASIIGTFSQNLAEAEMQAIHLNVEFVTKNIIKHALIEIDINR